uniref:Kinesin family member 20Ba n=1 Tax=Hippocampus comes TaxID=109280 RepID=A0A3Q2YNS3_HIPCM
MSVAVRTWCGTVQPSSSEDREHVKVYLRVRPFTATEAQNGESQDCVSVEPPDTVLLRPPSAPPTARLSSDKWDKSFLHTGQRFRFSQVYGPDATQRELFQGTAKDLVQDVLHGGNSLLFTYGVTNAGKTFTFLGPDGDAGILPRSLDAIFSSMEGKVSTGPSIKPQRCREFVSLSEEQRAEEAAFKDNLLRHLKEVTPWPASCHDHVDHLSLQVEADSKFSIWVSFCEIYKENIHDLLEAAPGGAARRTPLRLSQDVKGNTFVKDLRWVQVDSAHEAYQVMKLGKKNQSFSSTGINQLSSRSHSIFSIRILRMKDDQSARVVAVSELCLCDLAGSERCAKTQNWGERLKEAGNINTSLLILGKCISALRHNQHAKSHVPFRESKLTHYLQSFFCGRGKVCMMVNVNQCASTYDETLQVLKFSALAQKVRTLRAAMFFFFAWRETGWAAPSSKDVEVKAVLLFALRRERLARETQLLEERAEKRLEIFKMMTNKMAACREAEDHEVRCRGELQISLYCLHKSLKWNREAADEYWPNKAEINPTTTQRDYLGGSSIPQNKSTDHKNLGNVQACLNFAVHHQADGPNADELESKLQEQEAQMAALQKKLQEAQARRDEDDVQALHECRRREAERRRELLAAAHEAIQQKDAELEKRSLEIAKLKELAKQDSDKVQSLSANLQRKEEDSSDLREKLADYKKQIQQVHKDISSMKEEERLLRQKLSDVERLKKQLQSDLTNRDRTIQQLKAVGSESLTTPWLHDTAKQRLVDDMRSALAEQEETQEQMERMLDDKLHLIQELNNGKTYGQSGTISSTARLTEPFSVDGYLLQSLIHTSEIPRLLKSPSYEKHLTERQKWQEEKMALIGQIKEAEDKRNQEMKKFAEDRERYLARQAELAAAWRRRKVTQCVKYPGHLVRLWITRRPRIASQGSSGCPSVLESSEISTENGRASRFPQPEMEISFSPLQPDRMALRRRGDPSAVTVKITRSNRKRKSADMDKVGKRPSDRDRGATYNQDEVEAENRRNAKVTPTLSEHQEESRSLAPSGSRMARTRKDATLQKIGDFLQSSPTLIGSKAKKMMGLVSASSSSSSIGLRSKKSKRKLFSADISSPMAVPAHPVPAQAFHSTRAAFINTLRARHRMLRSTACGLG